MIGTVAEVLHELLSSFDVHYSDFKGWANDNAETIERWANAADALLANVAPQSTTAKLARTNFINTMSPLNYGVSFIPLIQAAFAAYAGTLASGMTGYQGIPPSTPIPIPVGGLTQYGAPVFQVMAVSWVAWAKTGTAIQGNNVINWS